MNPYEELKTSLITRPESWLVTGAAGFIGSHLVEALLKLDQHVVGLDNFATAKSDNLDEVKDLVGPERWSLFRFIEGDLADLDTCKTSCSGITYVLHQGAIGSVPRSIDDPLASHRSNDIGMINMLIAARNAKVRRFVYASSSSVYGDDPELPKVENRIGKPLSPYAATKRVSEIYADVFGRCYAMELIGLRYFNVFGARQNFNGTYSAVIPKWVSGMLRNEQIHINGTGETSRDFCYIDNIVQANLLAAKSANPKAVNRSYNIAVQDQTSLNDLFEILRQLLLRREPHLQIAKPKYRDFRKGDAMHTLADIGRAKSLLGYQPTHSLRQGLELTIDWYLERRTRERPGAGSLTATRKELL